ncbi:MAG: nucleotidyltransferase family protein, partial [Clostridia bacterium]
MNIYGIICEYNPLHNGHEYHIARTRKLGADAIVCVMSGCFVQRAEPAIMSKFARAKCAIAAGADLVIELPSPWSTASAEAFARGAMSILGSLGCVTHCSFGCEAHDISTLCATADTLLNASFYEKVRDELSRGISFPAARARVMAREFPHLASVLDTPNNILAVEYIKAIYSQKLNIEPVAITRIGAAHDSEEAATFPSASALRTLINSGDIESALCAMPPSSAKIFRD